MLYQQDEHLQFIQEKIADIKIALFKSEINSELQLPNNIIQTLKVDEDGHIWFFTSCTGDYAQNVEKSFYAYLDYYRKGTDCRIQLSGKASIIDDVDDGFLNISDYGKSTASRLVLIKMKIMQAEYFENRVSPNLNWREKIKGLVQHLFFSESHRVYDFN